MTDLPFRKLAPSLAPIPNASPDGATIENQESWLDMQKRLLADFGQPAKQIAVKLVPVVVVHFPVHPGAEWRLVLHLAQPVGELLQCDWFA